MEQFWNDFLVWFDTHPVASFLRHLAAITIAGAVAEFAKLGDFDFTNWRTWVIAGLVASLPALINWLNPQGSSKF